MTDRTIYLGNVPVDSGHLLITDPCYIVKDAAYDDLYDKIFAIRNRAVGGEISLSGLANGVIFESGLGDGVYEVTAVLGDVKGWGERVKSVTITLIDEDPGDE